MINKPKANVLPLLVLVDRQQCPTKNYWIKANAESYTYWVLAGTHSLIEKQELAVEYEHVDTYKMAMCWVYTGLTNVEAKILALDHNIDLDFCLEISFIQKIRIFHNEWVDTIKRGGKVDDNFQVALCEKCGLEVKKNGGHGASQKLNTKQYEYYFQLAFQDGEVWDLQEEIFKLHEQEKLKVQKLSKSQGKGVSKEDSPPKDMKITPWRQQQGIRERSLIIAILSRVKGGSISLEQMGEEFERVEEMSLFVTPRSYTSAIADAPYGFCAPNSVNDDVKVYQKFKHTCADVQGVINPYQKPQLLMMDLIDLLSMKGKWIMDLFAGTGSTTVSALKRGQNVIGMECDPLQVKFIEQQVTALKELPNEFQEVGMKSTASDPCFFDASGEPQPPIGSEKVVEIVDLVDFEPDNVEVEEQASDTPLHITSMGEETRNEEEEDLPIQA
ncbi:hypothetical protein L7F22_065550 [Adiantum nelumboides]|nr:hypothetical protein [Adiantum nelumboides]